MVTGPQYSGIDYSEQVKGSSFFFLRGDVNTEPALVTPISAGLTLDSNTGIFFPNIDGENVPNLRNYIRIAIEYDVRSVESIRFEGLLPWFRSFFISPNFINHVNLSYGQCKNYASLSRE